MPPIQQTSAVRRRSVGRPRKAPPVIVQNKNEAAQYRYQAYQPAPKSPRTINSRIQKSTSPQSPRAARAGTTRSGRRYSPATPPRQEFIFEDQYAQSQQPYNTALDHRRAHAQEAQVAAHAEAQRRALATQHQHQHQLEEARAQLQSEPRRRASSSAARRLSRARNIYTSDPLSRPILYNTDQTQILYHSHPNPTLSALRSPDRSKFLHRQARIDDPASPTNAWSGFGEDAELPTRSYGAAVELAGKGYWGSGARVVRWGGERGLRLLERRGTLDALSAEERAELVAWWGAKYGGKSGETSVMAGVETGVASAGAGSGGRKGRSKKNVNAHVNVNAGTGWASQVWEYVRQRKWNRLRRKKETKGRPHFYDAQAEYDAAMFGSRESAESWRNEVAGAGARGGRG